MAATGWSRWAPFVPVPVPLKLFFKGGGSVIPPASDATPIRRGAGGLLALALLLAVGISATGWFYFMVAKVDQAEIFASPRHEAWAIGLIVGLLLLATMLGVGLLWRQQKLVFTRQELAMQKAGGGDFAGRKTLFRFADYQSAGRVLSHQPRGEVPALEQTI